MVPTGAPDADGATASSLGSIAAAAGPSVATTTAFLAVTFAPSSSAMPPSPTPTVPVTFAPTRTLSAVSPASSCVATASMPFAGKQFCPVASIRMTKLNSRLEVASSGLKKMPDMNGLKNLCVISSLNPAASSRCRIVVSGARRMS